jgi:hypothetical protein
MRRREFAAAALGAPLARGASRKFRRLYFHDKDNINSGFSDFAMMTPQRGVALGTQTDARRADLKGLMVSTNDGGQTWAEAPLKFVPVSMFALDSMIWAVSAEQELWFSAEGGRDWAKIAKLKNILRVHFLDDKVGFAVGARKTALRTEDGGRKWKPIAEAAKTSGSIETAAFTWVSTSRGKFVSLFGNTQTFRRPQRGFRRPDWADPENARLEVERPSLTIALDSADAGLSFKPAQVAAFGHVHRVRVAPDGQGLIVMKFERFFEYGGELYKFRANANSPIERILRPKDHTLQDAIWVPGDGAYVAMTKRFNQAQLPVPTPVEIWHSTDLTSFVRLEVDYRAEGRTVFFSETEGQVWAATDEGMILRLM